MILALSLLFGEFYVIIINTPIKRVDVKNITDIRRICIIIVSTIRNHNDFLQGYYYHSNSVNVLA